MDSTLELTHLGKESNKPKGYRGSGRGGPRINSGRPKGSTNKIKPDELLKNFKKKSGQNFHEFIVERILEAQAMGNSELVSKYILGLGKYIIQDVQEVDVTSNGETMNASFTFPSVELDDWKDV